jgi:hypothetical protein
MVALDDNSPSKDDLEPKIFARSSQVLRSGRSKTDLRFWKKKVFKPQYCRADGSRARSSNYAVEIAFRGRRLKWSLETPNQEAAAARAKEIFLFVQANGWESAIARYRPKEAPPAKRPDLTVNEFLADARAASRLKESTFNDYAKALRRIVADIAGIHSRGRKSRLQKIGAVRLSDITPQEIDRWKRDFIAGAKRDPISQRSARVSVNSYLKRAKCLCSKRTLKHLTILLADPLPFAGVEFEKRPSLKYQSRFDVRHLITQAREELANTGRIELFKIFVLAAMCGLRRREIDLLPWTAFVGKTEF